MLSSDITAVGTVGVRGYFAIRGSDIAQRRTISSFRLRTFTEQTAVARAVARDGERPHCARGERAKRVSRLGRCVAAVLYGAVRWGPGGLNGRGGVGGAARALSERAKRVRISRTAPPSTPRAFGCRSGWQF